MDVSHEQYMPLRHWHSHSETYSGGDSLLTALQDGWILQGIFHQHYLFSGRSTMIYHMMLERNDQTAIMRVVSNPFVGRFILTLNCPIYFIKDNQNTPSLCQLLKIAS